MKAITKKDINQLNDSFSKKPVQKALSRVLVKNKLADIFDIQEQSLSNQFKFSNEIKTLPVTNQNTSGRCWIFAGLNALREIIANKYDLKTFELSQNYTAFWDKFEKINYFIEIMDDFLTVHYDDRTLQHILKLGIQDGGQWDMFVSLIEKYGVVPKEAMIETTSSSGTRFMNQLINVKLRKYAAEARALTTSKKANDIKKLKEKTLDELYTLLVTNFGNPPQAFDFEYVSKDKYNVVKNLTPQSFYKDHVGGVLKDYVSIINSPTKDKPFMKTYTVEYLGNVIDGRNIKYINLEMKDLKKLVLKQMLDNEVVWFGSDVSRFGDRTKGIWDNQQFDYEEMLGMSFDMSKEDQLYYAQGAMNHAMLLTAVHLDQTSPKRWKIENSWGEKVGEKGYFLASDAWFDCFVYQAVINKKYLSKEQLDAWKQEPIILKPWDPMGALANN